MRKKAPQQAAILDLMCSIGRAPAKEICYFTGASAQSLQALVKKGLLTVETESVYRRPVIHSGSTVALPQLTAAQKIPYDGLKALLDHRKADAALLFGVTGSGKTTVYIHLMDAVLKRGQASVLLVPEIALTPQMIETFSMHFGDTVAVLHSKLSMGARYDEWKRIRDGKAKIIIGTRSAVFAPAEDIGLVIIDEEQEDTYKSEQTPRYHARDVAKFRCAQHNALLLLGSATPDVSSRYLAETGKYHYFEITGRYNARTMPAVQIVDLKKELKNGMSGSISSVLRDEIASNLEHGEQTILFLNRRGTSKLVTCIDCGFSYECPRCSVSLTYHRANHTLRCHHCGYRHTPDHECPVLRRYACLCRRRNRAGAAGAAGTVSQRRDQAHGCRQHRACRIARRAAQPFSGSARPDPDRYPDDRQGLNFEQVTLVGVLLADQSLYAGDFRAGRTHLFPDDAGRRQKRERQTARTRRDPDVYARKRDDSAGCPSGLPSVLPV